MKVHLKINHNILENILSVFFITKNDGLLKIKKKYLTLYCFDYILQYL